MTSQIHKYIYIYQDNIVEELYLVSAKVALYETVRPITKSQGKLSSPLISTIKTRRIL